MKYFRIVAPDLAIDFGTFSTLAMRLDNGVVLEEPTAIALNAKKKEIVAIGKKAKALIGKSPENITAMHPLSNGVIADFDLTQAMLEYYIRKALPGVSLIAPRVAISVPSNATDVENRAIQDACLQAGARNVYLVEEILAAAYGANAIDNTGNGAMILSIGAGLTEIAIVSEYGVITSQAMPEGGSYIDHAIMDYVKSKFNLIIGEQTAENIKIAIGTLRTNDQMNMMEASGRDVETGIPRSIDLKAMDITEAMSRFIHKLIENIKIVLEKTPPELAADIMNKGIIITGGASQIDGLVEYIYNEAGVEAHSSSMPKMDTINGLAKIMKNINQWEEREKHD